MALFYRGQKDPPKRPCSIGHGVYILRALPPPFLPLGLKCGETASRLEAAAMILARGSFRCRRISALEPLLGHRNDADVHRFAVSRKHRRLDLDFRAVRAEGRMRVICGGRLMPSREHDHLTGVSVDQVNAARKVV